MKKLKFLCKLPKNKNRRPLGTDRVYLISFFFSESSQSAPVGIPGKTTDAQVCILANLQNCLLNSASHYSVGKICFNSRGCKINSIGEILITSNNLFRAVNKGR